MPSEYHQYRRRFSSIDLCNKALSKCKLKQYKLNSFRWRVISFSINNQRFKVWIAFNSAKEKYIAHLGVYKQSDIVVLASYEYHGTHPGWHVHVACGKEDRVMAGRLRTPDHFRIPRARSYHRRLEFAVSELTALEKAATAFGLYNASGALL